MSIRKCPLITVAQKCPETGPSTAAGNTLYPPQYIGQDS